MSASLKRKRTSERTDNPNARLAFWITNPHLEFEDIPLRDDPEEEYLQEAEAWEHFLKVTLNQRGSDVA